MIEEEEQGLLICLTPKELNVCGGKSVMNPPPPEETIISAKKVAVLKKEEEGRRKHMKEGKK